MREFKGWQEDGADPGSVERSGQLAEQLLYRAPEHLRAPAHTEGSQKGDVYSFALILYEIHGRSGPFGCSGLSPAEATVANIMKSRRADSGLSLRMCYVTVAVRS